MNLKLAFISTVLHSSPNKPFTSQFLCTYFLSINFKSIFCLLKGEDDCEVNDDASSDERIDADELIELEGCGITSYWRFPQTTRCPSRKCSADFASRLDAYRHFKNVHSQDSLLCPTCDKPIKVKNCTSFVLHHRKSHGAAKMPYKRLENFIKTTVKKYNF